MGLQRSLTFESSVTLLSTDCNGYLEAQRNNESPTARIAADSSRPLLSFERSVFRFVRTDSSIVDRINRDTIVFGATVRILNPATMLAACVVRTESASRGKGFRVVMRSLDSATPQNSVFRIISNMRNRSGSDQVRNMDYIVLQLDNSELFVNAIDSPLDGVEIVASVEPKTWMVRMFDEGYSAAATGFAFASRVLAIEHRFHRSFLTHREPVIPAVHQRSTARRSNWQADDSAAGTHDSGEQSAHDNGEANAIHLTPTSDVYFKADESTSTSQTAQGTSDQTSSNISMKLNCSCTSLWMAENLDPTVGGPLRVGQRYRFRHMSSGRYLAVIEIGPGRHEVSTISESSENFLLRSVFQLDSNAEDDRGHVSSYHSFVRLQHVETSLWLGSHPASELSVARTVPYRRPNAQDRISLRHPSDRIVTKMLLLTSYTGCLRDYVTAFQRMQSVPLSVSRITNDPDVKLLIDRTSDALLSLLQFCSSDMSEMFAKHQSAGRAPSSGAGDFAHAEEDDAGTNSTEQSRGTTGEGESDPVRAHHSTSDSSSWDHHLNKEHQQMLVELGIPQLVLSVLVAPFSNAASDLSRCVPFNAGVLDLRVLQQRTANASLLRVHRYGLALLQRMATGSPSGSNAIANHVDVLLHFAEHSLHPHAVLLTMLQSCDSLSSDAEAQLASDLICMIRQDGAATHRRSHTDNISSTYLKCLAYLRKARECVANLIQTHERVLLYRLISGLGRLLVGTPRTDDMDGGVLNERGSPSAVSVGETTPFDLFITHGDPGMIEGFIATFELLMSLAPRERDSALFQFVCNRITRDDIINVLKIGGRGDAALINTSRFNEDAIHTIQSLFVKAAMQLYLEPRLLEEEWSPTATVVLCGAGDAGRGSASEDEDEDDFAARSPAHGSKHSSTRAGFSKQLSSSVLDPPGSPRSSNRHEGRGGPGSNSRATAPKSLGDASFIRQVKASTLDVLKANKVQVIQQRGKNCLVTNCVKVWGLILETGLAAQNEVEELVPLLLEIMDGRTDQFSAHITDVAWNRYEASELNLVVMESKQCVCSVLVHHLEVLLRGAMASAADAMVDGKGRVASRKPGNDAAAAEEYLRGGQGAGATTVFHMLQEQVQQFRQLLRFPASCDVLFDLLRYESDELANASIGLLAKLCQCVSALQLKATELVCVPASFATVFRRLVRRMPTLHATLRQGDSERIASELRGFLDMLQFASVPPSDQHHHRAHHAPGKARKTSFLLADDPEPEEQAFKLDGDFYGSTSHSATNKLVLEVVNVFGLHTQLLPVMREHPDTCKHFLVAVDFFVFFTKLPHNAEQLASEWPLFFDALLRVESLQPQLLMVLRRLVPSGNRQSPLTTSDIRSIVRVFNKERYVGCIQMLVAMLDGTVARPEQQRDIALSLFQDGGVLSTEQWWLQFASSALEEILYLLVLCSQRNGFVQVHFQRIFPTAAVLMFFQSLHADQGNLKTVLLQFLCSVHLLPSDTQQQRRRRVGEVALLGSASSPESLTWTTNNVWWRLVREEFSMRMDELATLARNRRGGIRSTAAGESHDAHFEAASHISGVGGGGGLVRTRFTWRRYAMECINALEIFFLHRFVLSQAAKVDWITKELRSVVSSTSQLLFMTPQLDLQLGELGAIVMLGRAMAEALATFNEPIVPRLRAAYEEASAHLMTMQRRSQSRGSFSVVPALPAAPGAKAAADTELEESVLSSSLGDFVGGRDDDDRVQLVLRSLTEMLKEQAAKDEDECAAIVARCVIPQHLRDPSDPRRHVIQKLLRLCGSQSLRPQDAIPLVLDILTRCTEEVPPEQLSDAQICLGACRALHVSTLLLDATDRRVISSALKLGVAVLLGGNTTNQDNFLTYFTSNDERFFISAKRTFETAALEVEYYRKSKSGCYGGPGDSDTPFSLSENAFALPCCQTLLRFIQLLCEGHHYALQEYCREQRDNLRSVNAVQFCVQFLDCIIEVDGSVRLEFEDIVLQCFANLTEFCQGPCCSNQALLVSSELIHIIERVLRHDQVSCRVKRAAVTVLIALVEGSTDPHVAETIMRQLQLDQLQKMFVMSGGGGSLSHSTTHAGVSPDLDVSTAVTTTVIDADEDAVALMFDVGIFLRTMADLLAETRYRQMSLSNRIHHILASRPDIDAQTGCIQIERDDRLELVYFRIPSSCRRIREDSKEKLLWEVDRSSQSAKYSSFHDHAEELLLEIDLVATLEEEVQQLTDNIRWVRLRDALRNVMNGSQRKWIVASLTFALFSNVLLLCEVTSRWLHTPIGVLQLTSCVVALLLDWKISGVVYLYKQRRKAERLLTATAGVTDHRLSGTGRSASAQLVDRVYRLCFGEDAMTSEAGEAARLVWCERLLKCSTSSFMVVTFMTVCAVLGLVHPEFFAMHLFWCIKLNASLQNVTASVTLNRRTLAVTLFLGMLFCYAFSLLGFSLFSEDFDTDDDDVSRENCDSLLHCFVYIATTGLRQGGGVGDVMKAIPWGSKNFVARRVYDFLYFSIMIVTFLNILFGIIIDTFAELRDAKQAKEQDMRQKCFVCGVSSHVFDQFGDGFKNHTRYEHNMWQYLYFMQHLRFKDPNDYTGQESYVALKLQKKDFSFFPTRSLNLEKRMLLMEAKRDKTSSAASTGTGDAATSSAWRVSFGSDSSPGAISSTVSGGAAPAMAIDAIMKELRSQMQSEMSELRQTLMSAVFTQRAGGKPSTAGRRAFPNHLITNGDDFSAVRGGGRGQQETVCYSNTSVPLLLTGNEFRVGENVATQTVFSESVVALDAAVRQSRCEAAAATLEATRLKAEMRTQLEEIRRLQLENEHVNEMQTLCTTARNEVRDLQRALDAAQLEKDAVFRQNSFLQQELDRVVVENAKLNAAARSLIARRNVEESLASITRFGGFSDRREEDADAEQSFASEHLQNHHNHNSNNASELDVSAIAVMATTYRATAVHNRSLAEHVLERSRRYETMMLNDITSGGSGRATPTSGDVTSGSFHRSKVEDR